LERGKSLLPSGITGVKGRFSLGNSVLLISETGKEVAVGIVNYHSSDISKIMGAKTADIETRLGFKNDDEVIHRDNLVLADQMNEGDELGLGAEIGINTSKLHAFGPMGLEELTTTKFIVYGQGQIRD